MLRGEGVTFVYERTVSSALVLKNSWVSLGPETLNFKHMSSPCLHLWHYMQLILVGGSQVFNTTESRSCKEEICQSLD